MDRGKRSVPPTYNPSLVFSYGKKFQNQRFYTLFDESYHVKSVPEMRDMRCTASCYGWLILQKYSSTECCVFNPVSLEKIRLPPLPTTTAYYLGALTSCPNKPNAYIVFFSNETNSVIFSRVIGGTTWSERKFRRETATDFYNSLLCCNEKIYLFSSSSIAVIDVYNTCVPIEMHENKFVENRSLPEAFCHFDYYIESCGDIFQVSQFCLGDSREIIRTFDVYKLDFSTMDWITVQSIGDRIFLLGRNSTSVSVSASSFRVKGNQLYFTLHESTNLYRFDMEDGTITSTLPCPNALPHWSGPYWVVPNCKMLNVSRIISAPEGEQEGTVEVHEERSWENLGEAILELILSSLSGADVIRFRLACKTWTNIHPLQGSDFVPPPDNLPWLLSLPRINKGVCNFYHPIYSDTYFINAPKLACAVVRDARYGWLLMSQGRFTLFFFNPLTNETIELPDLEDDSFVCFSFSSPPTYTDCTVLVHMQPRPKYDKMVVYQKHKNESEDQNQEYIYWSMEKHFIDHKVGNKFIASESNPVFYNGVFYCLSKDGKLWCFDPKETDNEDHLWRVLKVPPFSTLYDSARSFIMEYGGDILSVFVDHLKSNTIQVYRLDWTEMKWLRLQSLGDNVIFLSPTRSILLPTSGLKGIHNRIYFPMFREHDSLFYSLSTGKYHCFGNNFSRGDWIGTTEHWNCTWIQFPSHVTSGRQAAPLVLPE